MRLSFRVRNGFLTLLAFCIGISLFSPLSAAAPKVRVAATEVTAIAVTEQDIDKRIAQVEALLKLQEHNAILETELAMLRHKQGITPNKNSTFGSTRRSFSALQYDQNPLETDSRQDFGGGLELLTGDKAIDESLQLGSIGIERDDPDLRLLESVKTALERYKNLKGTYPQALADFDQLENQYDREIWNNGQYEKISSFIAKFDYALEQSTPLVIDPSKFNPSTLCYDKDQGLNYYKKGHITGIQAWSEDLTIKTDRDDVCTTVCSGSVGSGESATGECLIEFACMGHPNQGGEAKYAGFDVIHCPNGCVDGTCVPYRLKLKDEGKVLTLADITPLEIKSHPWETMLAGKEVKNLDIAQLVPNDTLFLHFNRWSDFDKLDTILRETLEPYKSIVGIDTSLSIKQALSERLGIEENPKIKDAEIAVISEDLDFGHDNSIAAIVGLMAKAQENANYDLVSPQMQNRVKQEWVGGYLVVSNSEDLLNRIKTTLEEKQTSLHESKDFQYTLAVLEPRREGMIYFSENLIRKLTGPEYRINTERRNTVVNALIHLQYVVFAYRDVTGKWPETFNQIAEAGYIRLDGVKNIERYTIEENGMVSHEQWGSLYTLKPIESTVIGEISRAEKHRYENFREGYERYWREFIDPVGIGLTLGDQIMLHTIILPLIDESQYNWIKDVFGGEPLEFDFVKSPDRSAALQFIGKWDFDQVLYIIYKESAKYRPSVHDAQRRSDLGQIMNTLTIFLAKTGTAPRCKNNASYCTFSNNNDGIENSDYEKLNLKQPPLDPEDHLPYWYAPVKDRDFIIFAQADKTTDDGFSIATYQGFILNGSNGQAETYFDQLNVKKRARANIQESTETEKRAAIIRQAKEEIKKELGITDSKDPLDFMNNEIMIGIGEKNEFRIENIQNLDLWIGVELKDTEKAKDFMTAVWRKFSTGHSGSNALDPLSTVTPLSPFSLFNVSTDSPLKNAYNNTEYYILPTGFVNLYYFYLNNRMYVTLSQATMNRIIDDSESGNNTSFSASLSRSLDYIENNHNIMALADLSNLQLWTEQFLGGSDYWLYERFLDHKAYFNETLTLANILPDSTGNAENTTTYFKHIPTALLSGTYAIKENQVLLITEGKSYPINTIRPLRSYYHTQPGTQGEDIDFDDIIDSLKKNYRPGEQLQTLGTFALGFGFLEDGLTIRLALSNPDQTEADQRFGAGNTVISNPLVSAVTSMNIAQKIGIVVVVLVLALIVVVVLRRYQYREKK